MIEEDVKKNTKSDGTGKSRALVLVNAPGAPYADVVVIAPGLLWLMQAKEYAEDKAQVDVETELRKMGVWDEAAEKEAAEKEAKARQCTAKLMAIAGLENIKEVRVVFVVTGADAAKKTEWTKTAASAKTAVDFFCDDDVTPCLRPILRPEMKTGDPRTVIIPAS